MPTKRLPSEPIDESMKRVLDKISGENTGIRKPSMTPYNGIERAIAPSNAVAITNPFTGNISYNPHMLQVMSPDDREQTVAHELTHTRQADTTPWYKTAFRALMPMEEYDKRPEEMEAYQAERDRSLSHHLSLPDPQSGAMDIQLPSMRKKVKNAGITGTN